MSTIAMTVVGDLAFHGPLAADPEALVEGLDPRLREVLKADLVVGNQESIICQTLPPGRKGAGQYPLHTGPATVEALKRLGIGVVSLANNHILDYGPEGLASTIRLLDAAGISHFGAGRNLSEATEPAVVDCRGLRIGFAGFAGTQLPTRRRPGTVPLADRRAGPAIEASRRRCDLLVVYFHEGIEAFSYPMRATIRSCRRAVDCGADLVVGTHPHTVQGIDRYRGVPIVYSIGNFVTQFVLPDFFRQWKSEATLSVLGIPFEKAVVTRSLVLKCTLAAGRSVQVEPVLTRLEDTGLPRLLREDEAPAEEALFRELCDAFRLGEDHPVWRLRDKVERGRRRLATESVTLASLLKSLVRLRPRHLAWYIRNRYLA